ncbi:MFS transporter [Nonomuraea sp. K274]|uniref:MFS transporter n=1 Tax=Nonomuraea cypriaca TaxID=1187855 RepID=A0A931EY18_9ACTN|nr:MFS transporter [Nonomuraea cypriaca]MBF8184776.1 MFS transporter [Nonomuraea cypriaca]
METSAEKSDVRHDVKAPSGSVLRHVPFLLLWAAMAQSALGDQFFKVGVPWHITAGYGGLFSSALVGIATALPLAILGLLGGVMVDRSNRFTLLVAADLLRAVLVGGLAAVISSQTGLPAVLTGVLLLAVPGVVFMPALQTVLPLIAGGDVKRVARMDAIIIGSTNTMAVLGPSLTGLALSVVSIGWLLTADAVSFAVSALLLIAVKRSLPTQPASLMPPSKEPRSMHGVYNDVRAGLRFLSSNPVLRPQFLAYPVLDAAQYSIAFLLPGYLVTRSAGSSELFGIAIAAIGVGRIAGLFLVSHTPLLRHRGIVFVGNYAVQGCAVLLMCATNSAWIPPLAMFFVGLPAGMATVAVTSYLQSAVPGELRGRVFAAVMSVTTAAMPIGLLLLGWIAASATATVAMVCIGVVFVAGGAFLATRSTVREAK